MLEYFTDNPGGNSTLVLAGPLLPGRHHCQRNCAYHRSLELSIKPTRLSQIYDDKETVMEALSKKTSMDL